MIPTAAGAGAGARVAVVAAAVIGRTKKSRESLERCRCPAPILPKQWDFINSLHKWQIVFNVRRKREDVLSLRNIRGEGSINQLNRWGSSVDSGWPFSCSNRRKRLRKDSISFTFSNNAQVAPSATVLAEAGAAATAEGGWIGATTDPPAAVADNNMEGELPFPLPLFHGRRRLTMSLNHPLLYFCSSHSSPPFLNKALQRHIWAYSELGGV